jgi:hypothetical protein
MGGLSLNAPLAPIAMGAPAALVGAAAAGTVPVILGAKGERVTLKVGLGALAAGAPLNGDIGVGEGLSEGVLIKGNNLGETYKSPRFPRAVKVE